eukprot:TRINITY_DN256_c0_g1_i1.p1 TRINITY_DN256_c0_g1~~TRINITY_DN256_c0_g1_i1.p1  ORF type:complete len:293 (-),score=38.77 TRINITY_DN256_c0_g1_i1:735-1589(-)
MASVRFPSQFQELPAWKDTLLRSLVTQNRLNDADDVVQVFNLTCLKDAMQKLKNAFPPHTLHAFAAKANPTYRILEVIRDFGFGCETASGGELTQALRIFDKGKVIFDSPAKTQKEIELAVGNRVITNIDNWQEYNRVVEVMKEQPDPSSFKIGFRINPQVGSGAMSAYSTATQSSKFGICLKDEGNREKLLKAYSECAWLTGIHVHVGSQGCELSLIVRGIRETMDLALEINKLRPDRPLVFFDIGGGLPVNFLSELVTPSFEEYATMLKRGFVDEGGIDLAV